MEKYDLTFSSSLLNSAGTLGFFPDPNRFESLGKLGAFVTNPISANPRTPALGTRWIPFQGGFILHTGYPNPGFRSALRRFGRAWSDSPLPVVVHLLAEDTRDLAGMVAMLEEKEGVIGVELGLPPLIDGAAAFALVQAAQGELPLIVRLPLDRALELAPLLEILPGLTLSLGPPRGALPGPDGSLVHGRLYGPALLPHSLAIVSALTGRGCSVIGGGGIYCSEDIEAMLSLGAAAVMLDAVLWRDAKL